MSNQVSSEINFSVAKEIPSSTINQYAYTDSRYLGDDPKLRPFFQYTPDLEGLAQAIKDRKYDAGTRQALVTRLAAQYQGIALTKAEEEHLLALADANTFTVTTAHQPSLLTGPLYYLYKIFSAINLAEYLSKTHPQHKFVPIYWNGGEDHDFEEVNHFWLYQKKVEWQDFQKGAVSDYDTQSLIAVAEQFQAILGTGEQADELVAFFNQAIQKHQRYADVVRELIHHFFGQYGLLMLDPMDRELKKVFTPYFEKEILERPSQALVQDTQSRLEALGFKKQAHPREVNIFYLRPNSRERITVTPTGYATADESLSWSETALLKELHDYPERFSPNVILRPLYQEVLLPDIAFVGGGGEMAYWLERKTQFEHFGVFLPVLVRRNSCLIIDTPTANKLNKLNLTVESLFTPLPALEKAWLKQQFGEDELSFQAEENSLQDIFNTIMEKVLSINPSMEGAVNAELTRQLQGIKNLESKLVKASKQKEEQNLQQLRNIYDKLFPEGGLQERKDNFIPFYMQAGNSLLDSLKESLNPILHKGMLIFESK